MGFMDKLKHAFGGHEKQAEQGVDKGAQQLDEKTGGKYDAQIDKGADQAKDRLRGMDDEGPRG